MRHSLFSRFGMRAGVASLAAFALVIAILVAAAQPATATEPDASVAMTSANTLEAEVSADIAKSADLSRFDAGRIISDDDFFNSGTMTESQIQAFLEKKVSSCRSGYTCLKDWYDTSRSTSSNAMCDAYSGGMRERASRIIYKVAKACGINPQVLLVMLEKEQGLVSHVWPSEFRYTIAMGQGCPDTAACDTQYYGFFNQVYGAARQMKIYTVYPNSFAYRAGQTNSIYWHPNASCGTSSVYIANQATANLYIYTPYRPNSAALNAGYGTGDGCSSYGNRNFYQYFTDWFKSPVTSDPCAQPSSVSNAKKVYVVSAGTLNARTAPSTSCSKSVIALSSGTAVQAIGVLDGWLKIRWLDQDRWISRDYVRYASQDESYCAVPGNVKSASKVYVIADEVTGRAVPNSRCASQSESLDAGSILQALTVNADRDWITVASARGNYWVERSAVRYATTSEAVCAEPATFGAASKTYVVKAGGAAARSAPNSRCEIGSSLLPANVAVTASAISADREWIRVNIGGAHAWVRRTDTTKASSTALSCAIPGDAKSATKTYVLKSASTGRIAPNVSCSSEKQALSSGLVVQAIGVVDGWLKVQLENGYAWIPRSSVDYASPAQELCAVPAAVGSARLTYVVGGGGTAGRAAPDAGCDSNAIDLAEGTIVQGLGVDASRSWLKVTFDGRDVWLSRADLAKATEVDLTCAAPSKYSAARKLYVVQSGTVVSRTAPSYACGDSTVEVTEGSVVKAVAVVDGWLKVSLPSGERWIPRDSVRYATGEELCVVRSGVKNAKLSYVVTSAAAGRVAPTSGCDVDVVDVAVGTIVSAVSVTAAGDWLKVSLPSGERWIPRDSVRYATGDDLCAVPSGVKNAKLSYVVTSAAAGRVAPTSGCDVDVVDVAVGTIVSAVSVTAAGDWLKVSLPSGERWIPRDSVDYLR
ncbi:hypothetical protein FHX48_001744 [Microbacterium halimionae]|uniref:SH3b domain-containing protein n=1 Tax=Microbacterium halimionae TaxID=1526413 RepID=A0A7W3PM41_9MICO|nr:SH3 domain-containing protein [Microbacterium halimionae]MBA8816671.1 hypothetical protein [Microbacterium halimionae]NII95142.1 hypothetical protein [Microbacterium halimionae]